MQSPFDSKNRVAATLDRLALRLAILLACVLYFFFLWRSGLPSLIAGSALFILVLLTLSLLERRTLRLREQLLRERVGGMILLEDLLLMPAAKAGETVCRLLCNALGAEQISGAAMRYDGEIWLVRCAQCMSGSSTSAGDVLSAHRARIESDAGKCALVSTSSFSAEAIRAAEWVHPPIRLINGRQLASLAGKLHPATDEEISAHVRRRKTPFTRARIRALAFSAAKTKRYLFCAFLLMMLYLFTGSAASLVSMLVSFLLAIFCYQENRRSFRL